MEIMRKGKWKLHYNLTEDVLFEQLLICPTLELDTVRETWQVYDPVFWGFQVYLRDLVWLEHKGEEGTVEGWAQEVPRSQAQELWLHHRGKNHGEFVETEKGQGQACILERYTCHSGESGWEGMARIKVERRAPSELWRKLGVSMTMRKKRGGKATVGREK